MAKYQHGDMDVSAQEKTFSGFVRGVTTVIAVSVVALMFLALYNS